MNDGIGLMSRSLGHMITKELGLDLMPSGFQGRLGGAKGFWIVHSLDDRELWIDVYPSQAKWNCDYEDPGLRTFEVKEAAQPLAQGALNSQFIPILEDRALDRVRMRNKMATLAQRTVKNTLEEFVKATDSPELLYSLAHKIDSFRREGDLQGHTSFLAGLPNSDSEAVKFLVDGGFDVKSSPFLQKLVEKMAKHTCRSLRNKIRIQVPRSTYAFMVVDFSGVLEEGEVHMAFSTPFITDGETTNELHGHDVLVARNPAHFPSDIQRVKVVYNLGLRHLKDVIVFSRKGDVPLAQLLSGGDYDGDKAWVCWDHEIVENFVKTPVPERKEQFERLLYGEGYLHKSTQTLQEMLSECGKDSHDGAFELIARSFIFNMRPNLVGMCTSTKDRVCYQANSISGDDAILLSTLAGELVDQAKQGITFTQEAFRRLCVKHIKARTGYNHPPQYKGEVFWGKHPATHILDWLKFSVVQPAINEELNGFMTSLPSSNGSMNLHDPHLTYHYREVQHLANVSKVYSLLQSALERELRALYDLWKNTVPGTSGIEFRNRVEIVHQKWLAIRPPDACLEDKILQTQLFGARGDCPDSHSLWGKVKASATYTMFFDRPSFPFRIAGRQLQAIKAERCTTLHNGGGVAPVSVVPWMYMIHRPNNKLINEMVARNSAAECA
ncbi:hypothetical protein jhhlp_007896 [Lomentospora prolificans]|uniref:RNA-dependent RNA polymerase n=1 Tax=Lomentospora prolificans TaxID=41688 RepID=A0A2N3N0X5_9PEZI|nr:hypothetical protein jhhlp_007896 [Lomentospora prolificans]